MLARWAPESERALMSTMIMAGSQVRPGDTVLYLHLLQCVQVGTIVGFYISGLLYDWVGWEAVFYIQGGACLVWLLFWLLLTSDTPASHPSYVAPTLPGHWTLVLQKVPSEGS